MARIVSCFKNKKDVQNPFNTSVIKILEGFKVDKYNLTEKRNLKDSDFQKEKGELPIACFGGVFSKRSKNNVLKGSGYLTLDFDKLPNIDEKRKELESLDYIYSVFVSPSGKGLKALVKIPETKDDKEYKQYYQALSKKIKGIDESGKDISRACFFSFDENIYINDNATEFKEKYEEKRLKQPKKQLNNDYETANRCLNIIRNAVQGERHTKILNASRLMGGFVEAGRISYEEAVRLLENEANHIDPEDYYVNKKAVYDGLEDGMNNPLEDLEKSLKTEENELKYGKIYYTLHDVEDKIEDLWVNGVQRGYEIGFGIEEISIKIGCTTYIYSAPYSGKTQVWFEILVNLSKQYGLKHAIFSPETGRAEEIFVELIECVARADFYDTFKNKMPENLKKEAKSFVDEHFIVIDPNDEVLTLEAFYDYVDIIERVYNVKIHTTTVDPFNEMYHDFSKYNNRQDMYIEAMLGMIRRNARVTNRHNCVITHVQDQQMVKDNDSGKMYYPIPTFRQVAGGQAWSRKGEQMLSIWRPPTFLSDEDGNPYQNNQTIIAVQKSKPKGVGKTGIVNLFYDAKSHGYYKDEYGQIIYGDRSRKDNSKQLEVSYEKPIFDEQTGDVEIDYLSNFDNEFDQLDEAPF